MRPLYDVKLLLGKIIVAIKGIETSIINAATETIGFAQKNKNNREHNPQVEELSNH